MPGEPATPTTVPWPSIARSSKPRRRTFPIADRPDWLQHVRQQVVPPCPTADEQACRFVRTLDLDTRVAETRSAINQSRCRRTEHHPTRRGDRFHPLGRTDCSPTAVSPNGPEPISPAIT